MKISKKIRLICILTVLLSALSIVFFYKCGKKETVIEFAMFNGSNWGVAVQESYSVIDKAIEKFESEHKGVRIKYESGIPKEDYSEWMSERALKDKMPDVFMMLDEDFENYINLGLIEKLDRYVSEDSDFDIEKYYENIANSGVFSGYRYALPYEAMPTLMFVNRTLLENFQLNIPDNNYTFDDFYRLCRMITLDRDLDGSPDYYGIYKYDWINAALSNDVTLFSKDGKKSYFNQEKLVEWDKKQWGMSQRKFGDPNRIFEMEVGTLAYIGNHMGAKDIESNFESIRCPLFAGGLGADVIEGDVSKESGLLRLSKHYNIDIKDTISFGDAMNDMEILKRAGIGVAMGNAHDKLKEVADMVTDDIDKDGVYNACVKLGLI